MKSVVLSNDQISEDAILGGRVKLRQPRDGYRAAIDPVVLAAAVSAKAGQRVLDAGAGVGTAGLCLATRVQGVFVTAIEKNDQLAGLALENKNLNNIDMTVVRGDITAPPAAITPGDFDHVMMNPPYLSVSDGHPSPNIFKSMATHDDGIGIEAWINFAHEALKPKGSLTMIYRADRLDTVISALSPNFGGIGVFPLWPKHQDKQADRQSVQEAKRVIVKARKGISAPLKLLSGLILHQEDGSYTPQAEAILRGRAAIDC